MVNLGQDVAHPINSDVDTMREPMYHADEACFPFPILPEDMWDKYKRLSSFWETRSPGLVSRLDRIYLKGKRGVV